MKRVAIATLFLVVWLTLPGIAGADPDTKHDVTADSTADCQLVTFTVTNNGTVDAYLGEAEITIPGLPGAGVHTVDRFLKPGRVHSHEFFGVVDGDETVLPLGTYTYRVEVSIESVDTFTLTTQVGTPPDCEEQCENPSICTTTTTIPTTTTTLPPVTSSSTTSSTTNPPTTTTTAPPTTTTVPPSTTTTSSTTTSTSTTTTSSSTSTTTVTSTPPTTTSSVPPTTTTEPPCEPPDCLPRTGTNLTDISAFGVLVLVAGGLLVVEAARRRHQL